MSVCGRSGALERSVWQERALNFITLHTFNSSFSGSLVRRKKAGCIRVPPAGSILRLSSSHSSDFRAGEEFMHQEARSRCMPSAGSVLPVPSGRGAEGPCSARGGTLHGCVSATRSRPRLSSWREADLPRFSSGQGAELLGSLGRCRPVGDVVQSHPASR